MKTLVLLFITCILMIGYSFNSELAASGPEIGEKAPDFVLKDMNGREFKLSQFKSVKPVVLIFGSCT